MVKVNEQKCIGCGKCASVCPVSAIRIEDKKAKIDERLCIGCGSCISVCPVGALSFDVPQRLPYYVDYGYSLQPGAFPHFPRGIGCGRGRGRRRRRGWCRW